METRAIPGHWLTSGRNHFRKCQFAFEVERETGIEPTTLSFGTFRSGSIKNRLTG
jgi:hypothetical protein